MPCLCFFAFERSDERPVNGCGFIEASIRYLCYSITPLAVPRTLQALDRATLAAVSSDTRANLTASSSKSQVYCLRLSTKKTPLSET
jgi:hypothetical protein